MSCWARLTGPPSARTIPPRESRALRSISDELNFIAPLICASSRLWNQPLYPIESAYARSRRKPNGLVCQRGSNRFMRFLIAFFALAGIVVSTLALRVHYSNDVQPCDINAHW